eukprot:TRINITY_DN5895_c1_g2_i1.p1 TRINITY_DN5895_c1_g2~~TRINITY_DN5895_c1_g2_i1.p1  ORF type:complete len:779 (+),score=157.39 TRINITY_DN5895_c1_g2_i1:1-2337(+)
MLTCFAMFFAHLMQNTFLSSIYVIMVFVILLPWQPRAPKLAWQITLGYVIFHLFIKTMFQLPLFCMDVADETSYSWSLSVHPNCLSANDLAQSSAVIQPWRLFGITKLSEDSGGDGIVSSLLPDLIVLFFVFGQLSRMSRLGEFLPTDKDGLPIVVSAEENQSRTKSDGDIVGKTKALMKGTVTCGRDIWTQCKFIAQPSVDKKMRGKDLYSEALVLQFLTLLWVIFSWQSLTAVSGDEFSDELESGSFSAGMVVFVLIWVLFMVWDRCIFLMRRTGTKLGVHTAFVLIMHWYIFLEIPQMSESKFWDNSAAVVLYILQLGLMLVSALQLHYGYRASAPVDTLLDKGHKHFRRILFTVFKAIPFLWEMRVLLNFICAHTLLIRPDFLLVEEVHAELFARKCQIFVEGEQTLKPLPIKKKMTQGIGLFCIMLTILLLPMLLFSGLNPALESNRLEEIDAVIGIDSEQGFFELWQSKRWRSAAQPSARTYKDVQGTIQAGFEPSPLKNEWYDESQMVQFYPYSDAVWNISPPAVEGVTTILENEIGRAAERAQGGVDLNDDAITTISLELRMAVNRGGPPQNELVMIEEQKFLTEQEVEELRNAIVNPNEGSELEVKRFLQPVYRFPGSASPIGLAPDRHRMDLFLSLFQSNGETYWEARVSGVPGIDYTSNPGFVFLAVSDTINNNTLLEILGSSSVLGLYLTIVLAAGRMFRGLFASPTHRIMFEELPEVDRLLELCQGIRWLRHCGKLEDELKVFMIIVETYRAPEILKKITDKKAV